jgi:hypothetical protein
MAIPGPSSSSDGSSGQDSSVTPADPEATEPRATGLAVAFPVACGCRAVPEPLRAAPFCGEPCCPEPFWGAPFWTPLSPAEPFRTAASPAGTVPSFVCEPGLGDPAEDRASGPWPPDVPTPASAGDPVEGDPVPGPAP